ncbi:unnamed protein product [Caenorhabditis bovis]|uniref:Receptor L-domain domain-containing protein n=1 Tax=Caenorhabditis bovis TaxID=2654633 RepID=A0A8S1ED70_9PELO|nr:unnamed protein product [Caenorhabditis bovis]
MKKKLCVLLILLAVVDIANAGNYSLNYEEIEGRTYCRVKSATTQSKVVLVNRDEFVWNCTSLSSMTIYVVNWSQDDINSLFSEFEYLYDVLLYIHATTAEIIDFSSLKQADSILLSVMDNPKLKDIVVPDELLSSKGYREIVMFGNPLMNDGTIAIITKLCTGLCRLNGAKETKMVLEHQQRPGTGLRDEFCKFTSTADVNKIFDDGLGGLRTCHYKPTPDLMGCTRLGGIKVIIMDWSVDDIVKFTSNLEAAHYVSLIIANSDVDTLDFTSMAFSSMVQIVLINNKKLQNIYFSDIVRNTPKFRNYTSVESFDNPQLSLKSIELLKLFCSVGCGIEDAIIPSEEPKTTKKPTTHRPLILGSNTEEPPPPTLPPPPPPPPPSVPQETNKPNPETPVESPLTTNKPVGGPATMAVESPKNNHYVEVEYTIEFDYSASPSIFVAFLLITIYFL